jgi:hypothetical protein
MKADIQTIRQFIQDLGFEPERVLAVELTGSHAVVYEGDTELEHVHKIAYTEVEPINE